MTRRLRRAHPVIWVVAGPVALVALILALADRQARPVQPPVETPERASEAAP